MPSLLDLEPVGDAIPGDYLNPNPQTLGGATDLLFSRKFKVNSTNYADYLFQIKSTTAAPATRIMDPKVTTAYLVDQRLQRIDDINSHLICVFAQIPSTWRTDYSWQSVVFPGVRRSSFWAPGDFPFRNSAVTLQSQVRFEHFYQLGPPNGIPVYDLFQPANVQGVRTSVLNDDSNPSSDQYISMVMGRQEIVVESVVLPWRGDIWERRTKFAIAQ